jgi:hypothetical protein
MILGGGHCLSLILNRSLKGSFFWHAGMATADSPAEMKTNKPLLAEPRSSVGSEIIHIITSYVHYAGVYYSV